MTARAAYPANVSTRAPSTSAAEVARLAATDLNLLVPLLAILEERSVTRAAEKIGLSQPATSHALARLRRLLGDQLVVRRHGTLVLTPRATELLTPLREVLHQTARLVGAPTFDPATDTRTVTIALTTSTAFVIGNRLTQLLAERLPHGSLRWRTFTVPDQAVFSEEGEDVVLLTETYQSPHPRERLYDDRWVVIAPRDAPADADALELLTTLPHVAFDQAPRRAKPYVRLDQEGVSYEVRAWVTDNLLIPYLVSGMTAVALHRYRAAVAMREFHDLRIEEFPFDIEGLSIDMVFNPHLPDDGYRPWLRAILLEAAGSGPSSADGSRP